MSPILECKRVFHADLPEGETYYTNTYSLDSGDGKPQEINEVSCENPEDMMEASANLTPLNTYLQKASNRWGNTPRELLGILQQTEHIWW